MTTWPSAIDYRDALQHPNTAFRDPVLQAGKVETNKMGVPRARAGAFANVYKLTSGSRTIATRVFLYPEKEREERYHAITQYLENGRPGCIVNFAYNAEGIRVGHDWFPLVTMDWVQGLTLGQWVRERVFAAETNQLVHMAERWGKLLDDLRTAKICHGDLQHDNVMVLGTEPVLVDYDCMCVPSLVGRSQLENGKPAYQHPARKQQVLALELDHFSAWIIQIALRALAIDPDLWQRYVECTGNENLLFCENDIIYPDTSPLWADLECPDAEVQDWARQLRATLPDAPFDSVPPFSVDPYGPLAQACEAMPRDWETITALADGLVQRGRAIPTHLQPILTDAATRIAARAALEQAIQSGDLRAIAAAYKPALLDEWAGCAHLLSPAREAVAVLPLLDEMEAAIRSPGDGRRLVQLWDQYSYRLRDMPEGQHLEGWAENWRERIAASEALAAAIQRGGEREIASAWARLEQAGGHDEANGHRARAQQAAARANALEQLRVIADDNREDNDRRFVQAWDEKALAGCDEAKPLRQRLAEIEKRLALVKELRNVIERTERGQEREQAVLESAARLPQKYRHQYRQRVQTAHQRIAAVQALRDALTAKPISEGTVAEAWQKLDGATVARISPQVRERCETAVKRRDCLNRLRDIEGYLPIDEQDGQWLAIWDEPLLKGCEEARDLRPRCQQAVMRTRAWVALDRCIQQRDLDKVAALAADPLLAGYPPLERARATLDVLLAQAGQLATLRQLLAGKAPFSGEHLRFIRDNPEVAAPYRASIADLLAKWLAKEGRLQASTPAWVLGPGNNMALVRWAWPHFDRVTHCLIALHPERFLEAPEQVDSEASRIDAGEFRRAMGGFPVALPGGRERVFVTIWPVIHVGWTDLVGPPLHVGPLAAGVRATTARPGPGRRPAPVTPFHCRLQTGEGEEGDSQWR